MQHSAGGSHRSSLPPPLYHPLSTHCSLQKTWYLQLLQETRQRLFHRAMVIPTLRTGILNQKKPSSLCVQVLKPPFLCSAAFLGRIKSEWSHTHYTGKPARVSWNERQRNLCWGTAQLLAPFPLWIVLTQTDEAEILSHNGTKLHYKLLTQIT